LKYNFLKNSNNISIKYNIKNFIFYIEDAICHYWKKLKK
jgi:hypothetical protein